MKIDPNDPSTTWPGTWFQVHFSTNENLAGNPFHLVLIALSILTLARYRTSQTIPYATCLITGFVLFSSFIKWQPWHSRLHLPLFVLGMPLAGLFMSNYLNQQRLYLAASAFFILALPYWVENPSRPLIGDNSIFIEERSIQYFTESPDYFFPYSIQVKKISNLQCNHVGLITGIDDWEYPLWALTKIYGRKIQFEHVLVDNPSGKLTTEFVPCAILSTKPMQEKTIFYQGKEFTKILEEQPLGLFVLPEIQQ